MFQLRSILLIREQGNNLSGNTNQTVKKDVK